MFTPVGADVKVSSLCLFPVLLPQLLRSQLPTVLCTCSSHWPQVPGGAAVCTLTPVLPISHTESSYCLLVPCPCEMSALSENAPDFTQSAKNTLARSLACLIHVFETLLCLSEKVKSDGDRERKCDLLFIISTISSAKQDFSLLITLSMKIKCFPKDLALAVGRKSRDLFKTLMNSMSRWFQFF